MFKELATAFEEYNIDKIIEMLIVYDFHQKSPRSIVYPWNLIFANLPHQKLLNYEDLDKIAFIIQKIEEEAFYGSSFLPFEVSYECIIENSAPDRIPQQFIYESFLNHDVVFKNLSDRNQNTILEIKNSKNIFMEMISLLIRQTEMPMRELFDRVGKASMFQKKINTYYETYKLNNEINSTNNLEYLNIILGNQKMIEKFPYIFYRKDVFPYGLKKYIVHDYLDLTNQNLWNQGMQNQSPVIIAYLECIFDRCLNQNPTLLNGTHSILSSIQQHIQAIKVIKTRINLTEDDVQNIENFLNLYKEKITDKEKEENTKIKSIDPHPDISIEDNKTEIKNDNENNQKSQNFQIKAKKELEGQGYVDAEPLIDIEILD